MLQSTPITGSDARICRYFDRLGGLQGNGHSDVVVITAGFPRKARMSRDDLLKANYEVIKAVVEQVAKYSPNAILIMVTNRWMPWAGGVQGERLLEKPRDGNGWSSGFRANEYVRGDGLGVSVENVHSFVLGGHGDDIGAAAAILDGCGHSPADLLPAERIARSWTARERAARKSSIDEDRVGVLRAIGRVVEMVDGDFEG